MWRELVDDGLDQSGFADRMVEVVGSAAYDWIIEARGSEGIRPHLLFS